MSGLSPALATTNLSVADRSFLITGGTQGLGLAIATQLRDLGACGLFLVSRSKDKGAKAVEQLQSDACKVCHVEADLSNATAAARVFTKVEDICDKHNLVVTGVVNASATTTRGNLFTTTADAFDTQLALNVRAPFLITQGAAKHMIKHGRRGSIVNICSVAAHGGAPFVMAYSCSKAALVALTKNNAAELAPKGIRVNGINMGWCFTDNENVLQTKQTDANWISRADQSVPLGRILRPDDVAATACFLLSDASSMTTASIVELHPEYADGMLSLLAEDTR